MFKAMRFVWAVVFLALAVTGCGGGGGGGGAAPPPPPSSTLSISGTIAINANTLADSDVNDPNAPYAANNSLATAQAIGNPAVVGGFASAVGTGTNGDRFASSGDNDDYHSLTLAAGQKITLAIAGHNTANPTAVDLDLGLYNSSGTLVQSSIGTGSSESITVTTAGSYKIRVNAFAGISNYVLTIGATAAAASVDELRSEDEFVPGEVIVRFKDNVLPAGVAHDSLAARAAAVGLTAQAGGAGRPMLFGLGASAQRAQALSALGVNAAQLSDYSAGVADAALRDKLETMLAVKALRARADVASADLNYIRKHFATPNDSNYRLQWHYPLINLPQAWDTTTGSNSVIVAVVDTGVFLTHPDLAGNLIAGYDFISNTANSNDGNGIDNNPDDPGDSSIAGQSSWHGTHVAGTIAAVSNTGSTNSGVAGVSWVSKVMPIRVLGKGGGTGYDIIQGIRYAARLSNDSGTLPAQRADIINLSLGGSGSSTTEQNEYTAVRNAGTIIIAAAGNDNSSQLFYPASYNGVVSVSAVDLNKTKAPYSNFGTAVDVAAPGGDTSVDRNGDGYPDGILSTLVNDSSGTRQPTYDFYQGTSMAAPHMAGVVALMVAVRKAAASTLTPDQLDAFLTSGTITNDLGAPGRDDIYGYGLIDAFKAVQAASSAAPTALVVSPASLGFGTGGTALPIAATKSGTGTLSVASVTDNASWLTVAPTTVDASGFGTYTANVNRTSLPDGVYSATITFTTTPAGTVTVPVSMQVGAGAGTSGNAGVHYVLLVDPTTFATMQQVQVSASGGQYSYQFTGVAPGTYNVVAGTDLDNDSLICDAGEACGAYPTLSPMSTVTVSSGNLTGINFATGFSASLAASAAGEGTSPAPAFSRRLLRQMSGR